jgi:hypothetical protein
MKERAQVVGHHHSRRLLSVSNIAILASAYFAVLSTTDRSSLSAIIITAGGAFVLLVGVLTFSSRARAHWRRSPTSPVVRTALAVVPWIALCGLISAKGLWWTQRPSALRFLAVYLLANWSAGWCLGSWRSTPASAGSAGRAVTVLAAALGALGIQGSAFGVTPFGCAVSAALAGLGALAFAVACLGGKSAHLKALAASIATLIAVIAVEATVRVLHIGQNVQEVDSREYARQFYSLTPPGSAFVNEPKPLDEFGPALIEINSLGIRGPELREARADLLLIGDSMIEARQLPWPETLGPRLEEAIRARGLSLRVVAHGMRGWSPLLEWNWYRKVGRRLQPDTVMLFFFWNDLWTAGDEVSTFGAEVSADGRPERFKVPVDSNWIWYKHVRLVRVVADVWRRIGVAELRRAFTTMAARTASRGALDEGSADRLARSLNEPPIAAADVDAILTRPERDLPPDLRALSETTFWPSMRPWQLWTEAQRSAASKTEVELQRFAEDVSSDGGRLVIVYVPNPLQVGAAECAVGRLFARFDTNRILPADSGIQTWLRGVAERHGIALIDPSAAMREFNRARPPNDSAPLYLRADCHWSERGHRFMAQYLAEWCWRRMRTAR